ncbi:MAG: RtcB family protein, partial [Sinobacteraceae bacterium]|nr:RtcB family protein [Nevskiaceae bacterium]
MTLHTLKNVRAWTEGVEVDRDAVEQLRRLAALPVLSGPIAVMPDVHLGKGSTVGTVIPTR